ncbi:putative phage abortive infection protein [Fulvivirga ulvae]|uniref:putative phage abortive infection protein n=1 Tax=Fulvivirga ulvae TaxID=2904245 RepID=UPI001F325B19|nr:putative phage abortive infection protein [Fulvivirga ulvae]UII31115.1 putative phage abortive infection protein [Fulvivirga ulvae]
MRNINSLNLDGQTFRWLKYSLWAVGFILAVIFLILFAAGLFINGQTSEEIIRNTFTTSGALGDSISGLLTPIFGFLAVITTFLAFIVQYQANQQLRNDISIDRFETKFYELLKLHQHNVSKIEINNRFYGPKAFVKMYDEIRFIYAFLLEKRISWNKSNTPKITDQPKILMELAYTIFFFGVDEIRKGFKTNFVFKHKIHTPFAIYFANELHELRKVGKSNNGYKVKADSPTMPKVKWAPSYKPFGGHVSKLGHYYRHLYQLVKFVASNSSLGLTFEENMNT